MGTQMLDYNAKVIYDNSDSNTIQQQNLFYDSRISLNWGIVVKGGCMDALETNMQ